MTPQWMERLVRRLAPADRAEDLLGDLEELRHRHQARRGRVLGTLLAGVETLEVVLTLLLHKRQRFVRLESNRSTSAGSAMESVLQDLRFGLKLLARERAFSLTVLLTLGVCIGANVAIYGVIQTVMLRPLPFEEPDRLVMLAERNPELNWDMQTAAPANALDWREQVPGFADVAMYSDFLEESTLTGAGEPRVLFGAQVTGNFFNVLGVRAALGRTLRSEETWAGSDGIVVLGHRTWLGLFGGDSEVIGRAVELNGRTVRIVGVLPEGFGYPFEEAEDRKSVV